MHLRACSMKRFSDKAAKCDVPADSEDDVTNLLSNPDIVKKLTSRYSNVLLHEVMHLKDVIYHIIMCSCEKMLINFLCVWFCLLKSWMICSSNSRTSLMM